MTTLSITDGKTLTCTNTLTLSGTDGTTMVFPSEGATIGFRGIPQKAMTGVNYPCIPSDAGKHVLHPSADTAARTVTIPSNASAPNSFPIGSTLTFVNQNGAGVLTISITADVMRLAGAGTTGSRTLAANGIATALKVTATEWIISGTGLS